MTSEVALTSRGEMEAYRQFIRVEVDRTCGVWGRDMDIEECTGKKIGGRRNENATMDVRSYKAIGIYCDVWIAAIASSRTRVPTLLGVMCNTSQ